MRRINTMILTVVFTIYTLCGCSAVTELVDKIKGGSTENKDAVSEMKDTANGQVSKNNTQAELKAEFDVPERDEILEIAEKYYKLAESKATAEEHGYINRLVVWPPDFTGKTVDSISAMQFSYPAAFLAAYTDLENVYLALNAAVFTFDVKKPVAAGNLASAIAAYPEDVKDKPLALIFSDSEEFTEDAAKVYKYALSLTLTDGAVSTEALPILLNYGSFCIDTGELDTAKQMFEAALELAPDYYPASEGMAAYWLAAGDKRKAEEILEKAKKPTVYSIMKKSGENSSDEVAPEIAAGDDLPVMEEKLDKLAEVPVVLATDFYENIDPEGAAEARRFVDNLAAEWRYTVPRYDYLSQYSTLKAFDSGQGQAAFDAFVKEVKEFSEKFTSAFITNQKNLMDGTGLELDAGGIDINDMIENPEKYEDMDVDITVKGLDEYINKLTDMAGKAQAGLKEGNTEALADLASATAPELTIFNMKPGEYANPTDVITQKYNMTVLLRKFNGYRNYFYKQNKEMTETLKDAMDKAIEKGTELEKRMQDELDALLKEHDSSHDAYVEIQGVKVYVPQESCDKCIVKKHSIHEKYLPQKDNLSETSFGDATNYINTLFIQKLKPNIEAMYAECMKNCMLISDPKIRKIMEDKINTELYQAVVNALTGVVTAYSIGPGGYPYICDCDPDVVEAAKERERKKFEEAEYNKTIMENKARKEFEAGVIKESSQLYQRLDKYSAGLHLMFMDAKWHPLKTEVKFKVKVPIDKLEAGADFGWTTEHIRNTTTYGGGLSASAKGEIGKLEAGGTLSVQGEMTVDGNGNVVRGDVVGTASGTLSGGSHEATGTYEASVMRGCKLSGEVARLTGETLKPPNGGEAWDDYTDAIGVFQPEKPKKILWKGEYKLSE